MSDRIIKRCKVCGASYESCYGCEKKHSWRTHTDTADHYYIFTVLMEYQSGRDAKSAYRALRKRGVDFFNTGGYVENVRGLLNEIFSASREPKPEAGIAGANRDGATDAVNEASSG